MTDKEKFAERFCGREGYRADYRGRWFYSGPALDIDRHELQATIKESPVELQWDQMGLGWVVYPAK